MYLYTLIWYAICIATIVISYAAIFWKLRKIKKLVEELKITREKSCKRYGSRKEKNDEIFRKNSQIMKKLNYGIGKRSETKLEDKRPETNLDATETKMTYTILILISLNLSFWLPYQLFNIFIFELVKDKFDRAYYDIFRGVYFSQYLLNFFVYSARSEQYRKAYSYFWKKKKEQTLESLTRIWDHELSSHSKN